jgi:Holliday junction resolvase RusA-like endonuclease
MGKIHFSIDGKPKPLIRHRDMYTRDKVPLLKVGKNGGLYNPKRDPSSKDKKNFLLESMNFRPKRAISGPIALACIFWMPIAKSNKIAREASEVYEEALKEMAAESVFDTIFYLAKQLGNGNQVFQDMTHLPTPDESNLMKFVEDALEGKFWVNDSTVQSMGWKLYSTNPRTEMEILW